MKESFGFIRCDLQPLGRSVDYTLPAAFTAPLWVCIVATHARLGNGTLYILERGPLQCTKSCESAVLTVYGRVFRQDNSSSLGFPVCLIMTT